MLKSNFIISSKLTIGIPVHNAIHVAEECLERIVTACEHNCYDYRLIIIDDNSNKETKDKLEEIYLKHNNMFVCRTEDFINDDPPNLGWNVNFLLDHIKQNDDYYLNIESDVWINNDTIPNLIEGIESDDDIGATVPLFILNDDKNTINWANKWYWSNISQVSINDILKENPCFIEHCDCPLGCILVKKNVVIDKQSRINIKHKFLGCDNDFAMNIQLMNKKILYTNKSIVMHCAGSSHPIKNYPDANNKILQGKMELFQKFKLQK